MRSRRRCSGLGSLLGIVRFHEGGDVSGAMAALVRGGIELVEVTIDTPGALDAVERAAREGRTVGVGTVVTREQVRAAAAAGAGFVVSPGLVPEVIETRARARPRARARRLHGDRDPRRDGGGRARDEAVPGLVRRALLPARAARAVPRRPRSSRRAASGSTRSRPTSTPARRVIALGSELVGRVAPQSDADLEWIAAQAARATAAVRDGVLSAQASG